MIGSLRGRLLDKSPPFLVLDVGGVGYELEAPMNTFYDLPEEGAEVFLFTHLLVREDAQLLFGFSDLPQRELFRSLLKTSGVGPRVGLAILSTMTVRQFLQCMHMQDTRTLTTVPGIGKKTAQRMMLEMRDRVAGSPLAEMVGVDSSPEDALQNPAQDAISALMSLGFRTADAIQAVRTVERQAEGREEMIRQALQLLSGN